MKSIMSGLVLFGNFFFATPSFAALDCSITSGASKTTIEVLVLGQYLVRFDEVTNMKMIYSCGPFVATGAGDAAGPREVIELAPNDCAAIEGNGQSEVIFCRP